MCGMRDSENENKQRASSSASVHHVEDAGRVITCGALAIPDTWFDKLFALMSFQSHLPVASNIWLALPPGFKVACSQTFSNG